MEGEPAGALARATTPKINRLVHSEESKSSPPDTSDSAHQESPLVARCIAKHDFDNARVPQLIFGVAEVDRAAVSLKTSCPIAAHT
jgi:hypothetical protein